MKPCWRLILLAAGSSTQRTFQLTQRKRYVVTVGVVLALAASAPPVTAQARGGDFGPAAHSCPNVPAPLITAKRVEARPGFSCASAARVIKQYIGEIIESAEQNGGCAAERFDVGHWCKVGAFACTATYYESNRETHDYCSSQTAWIGFAEHDRGP
jgi:hypothetical protein